jgi:D-serine deaminase-like pyridoxal phosphate-dependent protein
VGTDKPEGAKEPRAARTGGSFTTSPYARYREAIAGRRLPLALVDLDALEENARRLFAGADGKLLRVATKSLRTPALLRRLVGQGGARVSGLMTYAARETPLLVADGFRDLLLAYPTTLPSDLDEVARANKEGALVSAVADAPEHLAALDRRAREAGARIPVVVDVDVSYHALGSVHLGVLRSPLRSPTDVAAFAATVGSFENLVLHGVMAYEAQIAGIADHDPFAPRLDRIKRTIKALSRSDVAKARAEIVRSLREAGLAWSVFNGGGTGSLKSSAADPSLTEVTVGSGFFASHLFDHYRDVPLVPAAFFALQVVRKPRSGVVTCHGGGYVASGEAGPSRLPKPAWPAGLSLVSLEGAGEVQTPLRVPAGVKLDVGDPVFFRHAKAGELAEHFTEWVLVRGGEVVGEAKTYRGLGI